MERQHQARLRLRPSRWVIWPSVRSLTVAGMKRVAGFLSARLGKKLLNQGRNSAAGRMRRMHSASMRPGEKKSVPSGSQAG
jgi:hypothetical protein